MSADVEDSKRQTATALVDGILGDLQHLVEQQVRLTRLELATELRQRAAAGSVWAIGVGLLFLAAQFLGLSLAFLLHGMTTSPGTDPAWLPLWASFALVAAGLVLSGGILAQVGRNMFRSVSSISIPTTEKQLEQVPWTKPPK